MNNIEKLIENYKLRLDKTVTLYNKTVNVDLKSIIEIQLDIYKQILNDLTNLNENKI